LDQVIPVEVAEDYSKRIAYNYKQDGADPSGWDLTQLLRVPFTTNFKYHEKPLITLATGGSLTEIPVTDFEEVPEAPHPDLPEGVEEVGVPITSELPDADQIIYKYQSWLERSFYELYESEPSTENDWSARMWKLINLCFEAGMEREEVYAIGLRAKCNKYIRDSRPMRFLWIEVLKAERVQQKIVQITQEDFKPLLIPELVDVTEVEHDTFIDRYAEWATQSTDAVPMYHELCGAILLSAVLAGNIRIEVSYGTIVPNLWGLVLGESTLTRKTTAMQLAMSLLNEIDQDALMTNDGTAEGLLKSLSNRPGRTSIFYKDEVSGFFSAINNKKYLAGVPEILTHLYDSPQRYVRTLANSEVVVQSPVFIFFGGGVSERTYSHLSDEYVLSGFLPRFLIVNGSVDLSRIRPTGPKDIATNLKREKLINELLSLKDQYIPEGYIMIGDQKVPVGDLLDKPVTKAVFTQDAWNFYGELEMKMVVAANDSLVSDLALPTFERLSRSMMKLAVLLSALRQEPKDSAITVEILDIKQAARFVQKWGRYSIELIMNVSQTEEMKLMEKIRTAIDTQPGIYRSEIMRRMHLNSREMNDIIGTLIDRGEIIRKVPKSNRRSEQYWIAY
jgi:hypothetical protein